MEYARDEFLFPLWTEPYSRWEKAGLKPEQEHRFNRIASVLVGLFLIGWVYSIGFAPREDLALDQPPVAQITSQILRSPLAADAPPEPAFLVDEFVKSFGATYAEEVGGQSGAVKVEVLRPGESLALPATADSLPQGAQIQLQPAGGESGPAVPANAAPTESGIWNLVLRVRDAIRPASSVSVITLVPLSAKQNGRIGTYRIGSWPYESGGAPKAIYRPPRGLIEVTQANRDVWVSEHVRLRDFLTKGQADVWPKYIAMDPRVLDKVELTLQELERMGHPVEHIFVVSAFRTPSYNESGGDPRGRASLSRHMYGDAMDICIDNDQNGRMDDLNGDGRVTVADARVLAEAANRVEQKYPDMIGGVGTYAPTGAHAGFVHVDTRGYRARW